jgi:hypothetical protein
LTITITGGSDDLIEVAGDLNEEFGYANRAEGDLLAFSDGTILRIFFSRGGVWRINPVHPGTAALAIVAAPEDDEDNYADVAMLTGDIAWVVHGQAHAAAKNAC